MKDNWIFYSKNKGMFCKIHYHFFKVGGSCEYCLSPLSDRNSEPLNKPAIPTNILKLPMHPMENVETIEKKDIPNQISVGTSVQYTNILTYYNPHNCRVYFDFKKDTFKPQNRCQHIGCSYSIVNSTEYLFKNYKNCNICVKKNLIEIRPLNNKWYVLEKDKPESVELQKKQIEIDILNRCTDVLKDFISVFGGSSSLIIHHFRILERKFMGDAITKQIPTPIMFRNDVVKKLYNEKNIEYSDGISDFNNVAYHSNYTKNLGLMDFSAQISEELDLVNKKIDLFDEKALKPLTAQIVLHLEVMNNINKSLEEIKNVAIKQVKKTKEIKGIDDSGVEYIFKNKKWLKIT